MLGSHFWPHKMRQWLFTSPCSHFNVLCPIKEKSSLAECEAFLKKMLAVLLYGAHKNHHSPSFGLPQDFGSGLGSSGHRKATKPTSWFLILSVIPKKRSSNNRWTKGKTTGANKSDVVSYFIYQSWTYRVWLLESSPELWILEESRMILVPGNMFWMIYTRHKPFRDPSILCEHNSGHRNIELLGTNVPRSS